MQLSGVRPSVCPSVCPSRHAPARYIDRSLDGRQASEAACVWRANAGSVTLSAYVVAENLFLQCRQIHQLISVSILDRCLISHVTIKKPTISRFLQQGSRLGSSFSMPISAHLCSVRTSNGNNILLISCNLLLQLSFRIKGVGSLFITIVQLKVAHPVSACYSYYTATIMVTVTLLKTANERYNIYVTYRPTKTLAVHPLYSTGCS